MEDVKEFSKRVKDVIGQVINQNTIKSTNFLTLQEIDVVQSMVSKADAVSVTFFGGIDVSERRRARIFPSFMNESKIEDNVSVFRIEPIGSIDGKITHPQILGSLMGLNIERPVVGDIVVSGVGMYFAVAAEFSGFVIENFTKVGRYDVKLKLVVDDVVVKEDHFQRLELIVSSFRLDVMVKGLVNVSRSDATEYLSDGRVQVNHVLVKKPSKVCNLGDVLSIRGHGRFTLDAVKNTTRSGKSVLVVLRNV